MGNVEGPKSALSDYIEENGIKFKSSKRSNAAPLGEQIAPKKKKGPKKVSRSKPFGVVNLETSKVSEDDREFERLPEYLDALQ